jgi:predicted aminopeptidase
VTPSSPTPHEGPETARAPITRTRSLARAIALALAALATLVTALSFTACSPIYVIKAGIAEARILAARRPIPEVILDPATDARTRDLLTLAAEARRFARDSLGLDVGRSYTSFTQLESDTLVLVLSAAHRDRLVSRTWWFPIVGRVPYRGFFDFDEAREQEAELAADGFDTLLRPTAAFSTLGWFADPLLSSLLGRDDVELVETVIHELSHNHLFVPGQVRFNESYATFVGRAGAAEFFCHRDGGGPDTVKCLRARARWRDAQRYSLFLDVLVGDLQGVYADSALTYDAKLAAREEVYAGHQASFAREVAPTFEALAFGGFLSRPLNNAVILGQMRYYHRLVDFQAFAEANGGVAAAIAGLARHVDGADGASDPFAALPTASPAPLARPPS